MEKKPKLELKNDKPKHTQYKKKSLLALSGSEESDQSDDDENDRSRNNKKNKMRKEEEETIKMFESKINLDQKKATKVKNLYFYLDSISKKKMSRL